MPPSVVPSCGNSIQAEKRDRAGVKGRREAIEAELARVGKERRVPLPRRRGFLINVVEPLALPGRSPADAKSIAVTVECQRVGGVSLKLDGVGSSAARRFNDLHRTFEFLMMICRQLGDHISALAHADSLAVNL